ncbi:hypothetical protein GYMLUDRAFT_246825 [Collybiopsis luxurians FD-317 M1]|uniref:Uncharacterized protein n=1 Tax=Collybiopsis luxurians FD-317 M1 TaxID=944289 RepID=A0A0D0C502_9AGAR|nr:hypothetical protein GYMLUDRAFT_246825 [Collybiopsis luxurians FD-317 M1]
MSPLLDVYSLSLGCHSLPVILFLLSLLLLSSREQSKGELVQCATLTGPLNFNSSQWIWTTELVKPPNGSKVPVSLSIVFAVDNEAVLWVNSNPITSQVGGSGDNAAPLLIAFNTTNNEFQTGLLVSALATYLDNSTSSLISDGSWRVSVGGVPDGFQSLYFDEVLGNMRKLREAMELVLGKSFQLVVQSLQLVVSD